MKEKEDRMQHFSKLLENLEKISLEDIAQIPQPQQHILAEKIESLQDELIALIEADKQQAH